MQNEKPHRVTDYGFNVPGEATGDEVVTSSFIIEIKDDAHWERIKREWLDDED